MKLQTMIIALSLSLSGCAFHSEPETNQDFHQVSQLSELGGIYKNAGDPSGYLSKIIGISPEANHGDIELIEVSSTENSLVVKAVRNGCSIHEKHYILDRDFKISDGKIVLRKEAHLLSRGTGDVLVGPSYEQVTLGLDAGKHGKMRESVHAAGLVFLVWPVAFTSTDDVRFERVNDRPSGFEACK
jgi:hypothetical protein